MESHNLSGLFADRYTIERSVGRGASATVYLAHDQKQDRPIALKVLDNELAHVLGTKRFLQEIRITSRLQHPHILPIHDSGEWKGFLFYVLPFVKGESLRERLVREKQIPIDDCVQLTCDIASALEHAHAHGVIHRDVKPENIMLSEGHALVADFGIARAIDIHTGERLTSSGLIIGTSQYMSPEQASGEREIDARSDIYSLGCVLYEMLAGIEPFVGPSAQAVIAQRFTHSPRPVKMFRPSVPENLERAVERALAVAPADRFKNMKEFAAALPATAESPADRRRPGRRMRDAMRTRQGKFAALAVAAFVMTVSAAALSAKTDIVRMFGRGPQLDTALYVVLPMLDGQGAVSNSGKQSADLVYRAMGQWDSLPVVPDLTINDALAKSGNPAGVKEALRRARDVGAGRMVWGTVGANTASLQLWDVNNGIRIREVIYSPEPSKADAAVTKLFRDPAWPQEADGILGKSKSFTAWQSYGRAHGHLKQWDLDGALKDFDRTVKSDGGFAAARLWRAQVRSWREHRNDADSAEWARDAAYAASRASQLSPREATLARALFALSTKDFAASCAEYRQLIAADSTEFIAWHGLGKCEMLDGTVVKIRSAPGWAFRSSWGNAVRSFARVVRLEPRAYSIVTFDAMQTLLITSRTKIRFGTDPASGTRFAAYPVIVDDTLAFNPHPLREFATFTVKGRNEALDRNALELLAFTQSWTEADSANAVGWEAYAAALETGGRIRKRNESDITASVAIHRALRLTADPVARVQLTSKEVRLRIKRGEFASASRIADSVLSHTADSIGTGDLLVLAAFTGKIDRMVGLLQLYRKHWMPITALQYKLAPDLVATAAELFARAAVGDCSDAVDTLEKTFNNQVESYVSADDRQAVRHILLSKSYSMLSPCTNGASALKIITPENHLYRLQQAYAKKDSRQFRLIADSLNVMTKDSRPADRSADYTFQEAWVLSAEGDTAAAIRKLDLALNALPSMSSATLVQPAGAAGIARMMVLRAEIAAKTRDMETARRWSKAVTELWRYSGKPMAPAVARMQVLSVAQ